MLGVVIVGELILVVEEVLDFFLLFFDLCIEENVLFMLMIWGESMINVGILDGD